MTGVDIVNSLAVLLIITSLLVVESRSPRLSAHLYSLQSLVLVLIFISLAVFMEATPLYIWSITALLTKVILVPLILVRALRRVGDEGEPGTILSPAASVLTAAIFVGLAFIIVTPFHNEAILKLKPALAVSIAHFLLGLLCILTRRNAVKQILGYCLMENGSHLTLAFMAYNAPETVEIGILTDAIFAVLIMCIITKGLFRVTGTLDTDRLTSLKG
ncbi:hydrogenase-4 membrane subunit E [Thermacetogenium phaeum DSM 12270]|uniref:Hydrogenase-4 membrane subunit E n=3 Tax=Thermacetogenium phaeum TaxID=85874 RepID=K4LIW7_THEPS|nr:hydrogenase 4 membrane subunit [Thermacetogenium phaeum]AFV12798.1 hydrogenase-4 membrane subunit E [Thermacetogenium phaeum DSM 12270]MDK2881321.1 hydrogenase-4 component [Clostridia bacterium]MDN5365620.1 hydrogenase-4 component [Thermacetogenium sp.]